MVALLSDATAPTLLLLLAEPLVWTLLAAAFLWAALTRRPLPAAAAVTGWLLLVAFVRWPIRIADAPSPPPGVDDALRACVARSPAPAHAVRLLTWRADADADPEPLLALRPDIVVLHDVSGPDLARATASATGGRFLHSPEDRTAVVVPGGGFQPCSDADGRERWSWPLPGMSDRSGAAVLAVAELPRGGAVPVVAARFDRPADLADVASWPRVLQESGAAVSGLADTLPSGFVVVAADTTSHGTFRGLHGVMASAPLHPAPGLPTWPARVGPLPTPTLYHGDRVWYGPGWRLGRVGTVRIGGGSGHLAYLAELHPTPP